MSNELTTLSSLTNLPMSPAQVGLAKYQTTEWLQRIQLISKGKYIDEQKIAPGHYGIPGAEDEIQDLGDSIDILPLAVRDKALDMNVDPPIVSFNQNDPVFQDIEERSNSPDSGCMWGPSFLVFERNTGRFFEFYCGSKSSRVEAGKFAAYLPISEELAKACNVEPQGPRPLTLRSKLIKRPRYSWHVPVVSRCSTPFKNLPPAEAIIAEIKKFLDPKENRVEMVQEKNTRR